MRKKFLVAVDGSEHGWKALDLATDLAKATDASLIVLHVVPYEPMPEGLRKFAKSEGIPVDEEEARYHEDRALGDSLTREAEERAKKKGAARVTAVGAEGNPAAEIVALAEAEGVDMLFVGSRGLSDASSLLLGGVSHKVMHLAPCTCIAVK